MVYFLQYRAHTSRPTVLGDITLESVRALKDLRKWEQEHSDVEPPTIDPKDWPRTIEAIEEWFRGCLGVTKIPLLYVIRETIEVQPPNDEPSTSFPSRQDELIARAPIVEADGTFNMTYLSDRAKVWELLSDLTRSHDCFTYV